MKRFLSVIALFATLAATTSAYGSMARLIFEDAEAAFSRGNYQETLSKLEEAERELGKMNAPILHLRILARYELVKGPDKQYAPEDLQHLRRDCHVYLSRYVNVESLLDKARDVHSISKALVSYPDPEKEKQDAEILRAMRLSVENRYKEAISVMEGFLVRYPDSLQTETVLITLARAHSLSGDKTKSVAILERVLTEFPSGRQTAQVKWEIALDHESQKDLAGAKRWLRRAIEDHPNDPYAGYARIRLRHLESRSK